MSAIVEPPRPRHRPAVEPLEVFEACIRARHRAEPGGPRPIGEILDEVYVRIARRRREWLASPGAD